MRTIKCDGCGCELTEATAFGVVVGGTVPETFDLCGECRDALIDWLASRQRPRHHQGWQGALRW